MARYHTLYYPDYRHQWPFSPHGVPDLDEDLPSPQPYEPWVDPLTRANFRRCWYRIDALLATLTFPCDPTQHADSLSTATYVWTMPRDVGPYAAAKERVVIRPGQSEDCLALRANLARPFGPHRWAGELHLTVPDADPYLTELDVIMTADFCGLEFLQMWVPPLADPVPIYPLPSARYSLGADGYRPALRVSSTIRADKGSEFLGRCQAAEPASYIGETPPLIFPVAATFCGHAFRAYLIDMPASLFAFGGGTPTLTLEPHPSSGYFETARKDGTNPIYNPGTGIVNPGRDPVADGLW